MRLGMKTKASGAHHVSKDVDAVGDRRWELGQEAVDVVIYRRKRQSGLGREVVSQPKEMREQERVEEAVRATQPQMSFAPDI